MNRSSQRTKSREKVQRSFLLCYRSVFHTLSTPYSPPAFLFVPLEYRDRMTNPPILRKTTSPAKLFSSFPPLNEVLAESTRERRERTIYNQIATEQWTDCAPYQIALLKVNSSLLYSYTTIHPTNAISQFSVHCSTINNYPDHVPLRRRRSTDPSWKPTIHPAASGSIIEERPRRHSTTRFCAFQRQYCCCYCWRLVTYRVKNAVQMFIHWELIN